MRRCSDAEIDALKSRNPVDAVAAQWVRLRKRRGTFTHAGPCPICSRDPGSRATGRFECNADKWVCAACPDGGDVIRLVMKRAGVDFTAAVEWLGGTRAEQPTPTLARKAGEAAYRQGSAREAFPADWPLDDALAAAFRAGFDAEKRRDDANARYRERERARLWDWWCKALPWHGTPVAAYLRGRGLLAPDNARLRFHPDIPLFADGREIEPVLLHRGPAMLAAIIGAEGRFSGLHITWLDPAGPKGKAKVFDHTIGEDAPAKKVRGSKRGGFVDLGHAPSPLARVMAAGEGIESVLAIYTALARAGALMDHMNFRCGIDLGNLAGKAIGTVSHPDLKTEAGRPRRVPGPDPDLSSPAMPVPDQIERLLLIGDGDSEWFLTRNALVRARARHAREGRAILIKTPDGGRDANDLLPKLNGNIE